MTSELLAAVERIRPVIQAHAAHRGDGPATVRRGL